ncbi:MAG: glycosyl hydrolase [Chitinophagaceae bacterium]
MPVSNRTTFTTYGFYKNAGRKISLGLIMPIKINFSKLIVNADKMKKIAPNLISCFLIYLIIFCSSVNAQIYAETFKNPPIQYHPKTWMHAMSGNMSKEGITKDFEAMAKAGLSGLLLFNVTQAIPYGKIKYASPEHINVLKHAAKEAERLGLTFGVHNSDGWSSSGGPWVKPEESMKMVVYSSILTKGGKNLSIKIPEPTKRENYYQDIITVAYPSLKAEIQDVKPVKITSSDPDLNITLVTDKKWDADTKIKKTTNGNPWIQFEYGENQSIASANCIFTERAGEVELSGSEDGVNFKAIKKLKKNRTGKGEWTVHSHFEPQNYKYYRLIFNGEMNLKEVNISSVYLIDDLFGRTAIARTENADLKSIGNPIADMIIDKNKIKNISKYVDQYGNFKGDLPDGVWTIMRFGVTSTGAYNNPASDEGRGLEVDKLSREAFKHHYDEFVKKVVIAAKPVAPDAFQYVEIDSYEMGGENWTNNFDGLFKERYGYDLMDFMPLFAGKFVESAAASEGVLQDLRSLISDLMTNNYFGYFQELCHKDGLKTYIENYGLGPLNDLEVGSKADMPMGEFWMNREITQVASPISAAHIYGRNVISAESFTSTPEINWKGNPAMAKISGDKAWAMGINEFMFHRFAHQANTHVEPGMTMNRWGFHMDRTQTWWYNAGAAWFTYVGRGSYLLRQGVPVSDLLVFVGDGAPNSVVTTKEFNPVLPQGINYDNTNSDVLMNRITVKNGELVLPEGTSYKALVLKNDQQLNLATLKRIKELSEKGGIIIGDKPISLLGYMHSDADMDEFKTLANKIWSNKNTISGYDWESILTKINIIKDFEIAGREDVNFMHRKAGEDDIYFSYNPDSVSHIFKIRFDISNKEPELWNPMDGSVIKMAQYQEENGFTNLSIKLLPEESFFIVFKPKNKSFIGVKPDKDYQNLSLSTTKENAIQANVKLNGKYAVALNDGKNWNFEVKDLPEPMAINGSWKVAFNKAQGYGGEIEFKSLMDWKDHPKDSIKYYAGTASYSKSFIIPADFLKQNRSYVLDLGKVNIVAEVKINGKDLGVLWMPPFQTDISGYLKAGENKLDIKITNQWSNRLIGDERYPKQDGGYALEGPRPDGKMPEWYTNNEPLPPGPRTTFTTAPFYKKTDPLVSSGLLGPVMIVPAVNIFYNQK